MQTDITTCTYCQRRGVHFCNRRMTRRRSRWSTATDWLSERRQVAVCSPPPPPPFLAARCLVNKCGRGNSAALCAVVATECVGQTGTCLHPLNDWICIWMKGNLMQGNCKTRRQIRQSRIWVPGNYFAMYVVLIYHIKVDLKTKTKKSNVLYAYWKQCFWLRGGQNLDFTFFSK